MSKSSILTLVLYFYTIELNCYATIHMPGNAVTIWLKRSHVKVEIGINFWHSSDLIGKWENGPRHSMAHGLLDWLKWASEAWIWTQPLGRPILLLFLQERGGKVMIVNILKTVFKNSSLTFFTTIICFRTCCFQLFLQINFYL